MQFTKQNSSILRMESVEALVGEVPVTGNIR
jgi:hypothetical protein